MQHQRTDASPDAPARANDKGRTRKRRVTKSDAVKAGGLIAFLVISALVVVLLWPYLGLLFEDGGLELMVAKIHEAGPLGVCVLLALQLLQVIVAFIPGEVVQVAAGMIYGPWGGSAIILLGCMLSSFIIYQIVHRLGQPFVADMVPMEQLGKIHTFEQSGRLDVMVFILFLIPGLPKDVFTYLVPLTEMPAGRFIAITTVARIPGVFMSTFAAAGIADGQYVQSIAIFAVVALLAVMALVFHKRIMNFSGVKRVASSDDPVADAGAAGDESETAAPKTGDGKRA
ncbi:MAG: VTT domain-containing protein [Eggerthellaceae bacterium]|nr:VTT domain-containing protein [Eggerthellaceae bacterium]